MTSLIYNLPLKKVAPWQVNIKSCYNLPPEFQIHYVELSWNSIPYSLYLYLRPQNLVTDKLCKIYYYWLNGWLVFNAIFSSIQYFSYIMTRTCYENKVIIWLRDFVPTHCYLYFILCFLWRSTFVFVPF